MRAALVAVALALALPASAPAAQGIPYARIARALKADPVYVDLHAELKDKLDAGELRTRIANAGAAPLYVAILPAVNGLNASDVARRLQATTGQGVYAITLGDDFAGGGGPPPGVVQQAPSAMSAHQTDPQGTIDEFIDRVGALRNPDATPTPAATLAAAPGHSGYGPAIAAVVLVLVAGGGVALILTRRRRRPQSSRS